MKLSLSTDLGTEEHWARVVEFASVHGVDRLVWWGDSSHYGFSTPFFYPRYPGLVPEDRRASVEHVARRFLSAAERVRKAGIEFWCVFQVLELPDLKHTRMALPELFNAQGEPDMSGPLVYQLICDQIDELLTQVPWLHGIEMWIMEGASVQIARLKHQKQPIADICTRIVETVYEHLKPKGIRLAQDLHTSGGDTVTLDALFHAASRHPDIILSGDNVIGDFHLFLPFNAHLVRAAQTNPLQVHFDLNGEYWGRNFVPTVALDQYASHLEEARRLGAEYLDGRVATGHNTWSPHANILPSRRQFYPRLADLDDTKTLPGDLDIPCTDTLGVINAEFFCRRVKDPACQPQEIVAQTLRHEFGPAGEELVPVFMGLQEVLGKLFFADKNHYLPQSVLPNPRLLEIYAIPAQIIAPPGTPFPTPEALRITRASPHPLAFAGWPTPLGHRCAGAEAMVAEKRAAVAGAKALLASIRKVAPRLRPDNVLFLVRQFEDLVIIARAACALFEAHAHYFLLHYGEKRGALPDRARLTEVLATIRAIACEWQARYPGGRYLLAERLGEWLDIINQ